MEYLSKQRYDEIAAELKHLIEVVYPQIKDDLEAGKISLNSPIGAALMGKRVGEIAEARVPSGTLLLRIENITFD